MRYIVLDRRDIIAISNNEPVDIYIDWVKCRICTDEYMDKATNEYFRKEEMKKNDQRR